MHKNFTNAYNHRLTQKLFTNPPYFQSHINKVTQKCGFKHTLVSHTISSAETPQRTVKNSTIESLGSLHCLQRFVQQVFQPTLSSIELQNPSIFDLIPALQLWKLKDLKLPSSLKHPLHEIQQYSLTLRNLFEVALNQPMTSKYSPSTTIKIFMSN